MIQIICPNNNIPERNYAISVLFCEVLGCNNEELDIVFDDSAKEYSILVSGECRWIVIEDHFFNYHPMPLTYMKKENLPQELLFFHAYGLELPIIYGKDYLLDESNKVVVGIDIFASTFFMLTRWEESLIGREETGDCDETQLFCVKNEIHWRPIVNEYANLLRKLLPPDLILSTREYEVALSHDVDGFVTPSWRKISKDFLRQSIHGAPRNKVLNLTWKEEIKYKYAFPKVYSQFDMYTTLAEKYKISEWFYFKVCGRGETEATYFYDDKKTREIVENLKMKGNSKLLIGFHPSQNTFGDRSQWEEEMRRLVGLLKEQPTIGRNHHLLYNHEMLHFWESVSDAPLNISNCVFHKRQGFRSGVCVPYHLFDLYQRRMMNLIEHPCQIMDTVVRYDEKVKTKAERWHDIQTVIDRVKQYRGELVVTWHIYIRNKKIIQDYFHWCEKVVQYAIHE